MNRRIDDHINTNLQAADISFLDLDHPGANDASYRHRRNEIAKAAMDFHTRRSVADIPIIEYTQEENETWNTITSRLKPLHSQHVSALHLRAQQTLNLFTDHIPQLKDLSEKLRATTGFQLAPIQGLINAKTFLSDLKQKTMLCTQYIRHSSKPDYTPEPDVVHECIGHVAAFTDPDFVAFSQTIGDMAERANEQQIIALERLYWYTIEFGLIREANEVKAFGAGLLSSLGELPHALSNDVERKDFDLREVINTEYDYSHRQPTLFIIDSFERLKHETLALKKNMGMD